MPLYLDHTIVPAHDKEASARLLARIFGLEYNGLWGHFAPVKINDTLTLDFDNRESFESHHYAFLAGEEEFDVILGRVQGEGLSFGSDPFDQDNGKINHHHGGRGFYFHDPNGHSLEVITHTYV
ncbi:MAG: VOC family protein [Dehalococcoidia bacterium]|nr:VOC family protein [Dehalococcoidia bacterium]